jgi:hypothetical protein
MLVYDNGLVKAERLSWVGIITGSLVGLTVYMVLLVLGLAIRFLIPADSLRDAATATAIWVGVSLAVAAFVGGFSGTRAAAYLRSGQGRFNGLVVGAVMVLLISLFAFSLAARATARLLSLAGVAVYATSSLVDSATTANTDAANADEGALGLQNPFQALVDDFSPEVAGLVAEASPELSSAQVQAAADLIGSEIRQAGRALGDDLGNIGLREIATRQADNLEQALTDDALLERLQQRGLSEAQAQEVATVLSQRVSEVRQQIEQTVSALQNQATEAAQRATQLASTTVWLWLVLTGICLLFAVLGGGAGGSAGSGCIERELQPQPKQPQPKQPQPKQPQPKNPVEV